MADSTPKKMAENFVTRLPGVTAYSSSFRITVPVFRPDAA